MTVDPGEYDDWIGREEEAEDVLTEGLVARYHAALDRPGAPPAVGAIAPRLIHWCLTLPAATTSRLGPDGHPARGGFLPPVLLSRRMWAGSALTFSGDLCVGDRVRRRSRIAQIRSKQGRTGPLCFVTIEHYIEACGAVVVRERQDIVYRADFGQADEPIAREPVATHGEHRRTVLVTPTLLFRYSALTFNAHRIHYDRPYAHDVEGYSGLVVHGPLQAALLYDLATGLRDIPPNTFAFRGKTPLTDTTGTFFLNATVDGNDVEAWTAEENGPVAMSARATWS